MSKLAEQRDERKEAARKAAQEKKKAKKQAEAMEAQAALTDGKPPQTRPQNKEAKKKGEAMAKQKAQAACETPQKRPQKQGGSIAKTAKAQGQPLLPVVPPVPKRCPAPAPSRRLGCSKCRLSVNGCLECCPLKHAAWKKKKKLEKMGLLKKKVEEEELLKKKVEEEELLKKQEAINRRYELTD